MCKTVALVEPIRQALVPFANRIVLAMLYGSVVQGTDTADSDIDLLVAADGMMLEDLYTVLAPVESSPDRKISLMLYTVSEFNARRSAKSPFLMRCSRASISCSLEKKMANLQLDNLARIGELKSEPAAEEEIEGLF